jgi:regulatory protein
LNEERFAIAFAGGKFRMKGWGRIKIEQALKAKGVSTYCIQKALKQIGASDYEITLEKAMKKKLEILTAANSYERKQKLARFFIAKGYESEAVWKMVEKLTDD